MLTALRVMELISSLVFVCAFFVLLGLVANELTGLNLDVFAGISGGTLWGIHLCARTTSWEQEKKRGEANADNS